MAQEQSGKPLALSKKEAHEHFAFTIKLLSVAKDPKDELRDFVIKLARLYRDFGVDQFDCAVMASNIVGCCQAFNALLAALGTAEEFEAANRVLSCLGIG
jgi:hypothetical protein